jgi:WXG100 family type VII secretion target
MSTMFDGITVHHGGLDEGAAGMARGVRAIEDRLARLESELVALQGEGWSGSAQQAYVAAKAQWDRAVLDLKDLLARTAVAVVSANQEYRDADRRGAALFGG